MKIALIGYGKMGKAIEALALERGDEIVLRITADDLGGLTMENLQKADVAIDFSHPEYAFENICLALNSGVPVVSGTTGWLDKKPKVDALCKEKNGAFLYASNFSIGVNLFFNLNKTLAALMDKQSQYDVKMEEIHHTQKLDAPSGTAITLAEQIIHALKRKSSWKNETSDDAQVLPIISKREENVPGTHEVSYVSEIDQIDIKHTAFSRKGFAQGALEAAHWLHGKKGVFGMSDVLGF
ncbi:MAG: 4-hydroxy-tetrahydrodipicolinate reductase [Saprospiraceae bacterium]